MKEVFLHYLELMEKGAFLEVIETYFDEDIIQIENTEPPLQGKDFLLDHEKTNLSRVRSVEIQIPNYALNEEQGIAMGEMIIHFDLKRHGKKRMEEAFVQKWENGKITYQRFYYKEILDDYS